MSDEKKEDALASCVLLLIGVPVAVLCDAFVLSKGWQWFVVPTFGVRALPFAVIVGLRQLYVVAFGRTNRKDDRKYSEIFAVGLGVDAVSLLVMWIAHTAGAA